MHRQESEPVLITDAPPSADDELAARRRRYALLMFVHVVGFGLAGVLYYEATWWLGLLVIIVTGALPWVAVVAANDAAPRDRRTRRLSRNASGARELDSAEHITINP